MGCDSKMQIYKQSDDAPCAMKRIFNWNNFPITSFNEQILLNDFGSVGRILQEYHRLIT